MLSPATIIDDLLDLSRLRTAKSGLATEPVDCAATARKVLDAVDGDARAPQLSVSAGCGDAPVVVLADPVRVEQIVRHLLGNASKFTPVGGSITVRLSTHASLARPDVADTGQGVSPALIDDVFDMFPQADTSTTRPHRGMGIEFARVRALALVHAQEQAQAQARSGRAAVESEGLGRTRFSASGYRWSASSRAARSAIAQRCRR